MFFSRLDLTVNFLFRVHRILCSLPSAFASFFSVSAFYNVFFRACTFATFFIVSVLLQPNFYRLCAFATYILIVSALLDRILPFLVYYMRVPLT